MLDIVGTIQATAVVEPSQISLGESEAGPKTTTITVKNEGPSGVTYSLRMLPRWRPVPISQYADASYNISGLYQRSSDRHSARRASRCLPMAARAST